MKLYELNSVKSCAKCGYTLPSKSTVGFRAEYVEEDENWRSILAHERDRRVILYEHILRTCLNCSYKWKEKVA